uniref:Secreted protein n=1 Tax=Steinernema glaseri TaxID=37863 RepID=A0A1I7ZIH3_9BILA
MEAAVIGALAVWKAVGPRGQSMRGCGTGSAISGYRWANLSETIACLRGVFAISASCNLIVMTSLLRKRMVQGGLVRANSTDRHHLHTDFRLLIPPENRPASDLNSPIVLLRKKRTLPGRNHFSDCIPEHSIRFSRYWICSFR